MNSALLIIITFIGYYVAYRTYGRFLAGKIFRLDPAQICPSQSHKDGKDFVPTSPGVLFGHHFTSIAGLGPIVGPAVAVIWGWLPAMLWVFFGSILMGAVHDMGSLVVSLRHQGQSIGQLASQTINPRVRSLFLLIIFFSLLIVIAVFALIVALLFEMYPHSVFPVWMQIPIALALGHMVQKKGKSYALWGLGAVVLMYLSIALGSIWPIQLPFSGAVIIWTLILYAYSFIASTLPVQTLLQPRDFINAYQLGIAMALLLLGIMIAQAPITAPALNLHVQGAPPIWPFLFVIVACGAVSGFHSMVSSGTSSKQCHNEQNALFIGYGSMLMEAALATLVIVAICAGLSMHSPEAFSQHYSDWAAAQGLSSKLGAFINGSANLMNQLGLPVTFVSTLMGVFLVSFATTTLDTTTRIQRYVISELAKDYKIELLTKPFWATLLAVGSAFLLAFSQKGGKGALVLWPLFGTINQLLAAMALLVITMYLLRKKINALYTAIPLFFMTLMTGWAMIYNLGEFASKQNWLLLIIAIAVFALEIWMIIETVLVLNREWKKGASK